MPDKDGFGNYMSLDIVIKTIPHEGQRYATVGDWQWKSDGRLVITVSDMKDWKKEFLVARHELDEVMLCRARGITQEQVDRFDIDYEASRLEGDTSEPGDSLDAPYRAEHFFATSIERLLAAELKVDWTNYEEVINSL